MLKNYFISAWRNLIRNKVYSTINITGLAIGLAACMLIVLYVGHESSYDRFHKHADRIFWIQGKLKMGNDSIFLPYMSYATAPLVKNADPAVLGFTRYRKENKSILQHPANPSLKFAENDFLFADSNFFSFFSFPLQRGNRSGVLQNPFTMVISPYAAEKYFGHEDPIGKILIYNNEYKFTVTGVSQKIPSNSSIRYDFVASLSSMAAMRGKKEWVHGSQAQLGAFSTYFLLKSPDDAAGLERHILQLNGSKKNAGDNGERYIATPLTTTHLNANYGDASNTRYLNLFPFIAALVLLLALTNYVSLSTARSAARAKEVGVRKALGAARKTIAAQFFMESALYAAIAFMLAYVICFLFQPFFFHFIQLDIDPTFLYHPVVLFWFALLFVLTIILAATYPSLLLSAYKPVLVLYGKFNKQGRGISIRKFITIFQFTMSVALIICGIVIQQQMIFFRETSTGVSRENIIMIPFESSAGKHYPAFKKEIAGLSQVKATTTARYPMYKGYDIFFTKPKDKDMSICLRLLNVDDHFIPLLGLEWVIPPAYPITDQTSVIINQAAIEKLNLASNPVGEKIALGNEQYRVAGVVRDFNFSSLHNKIDALCLFVAQDTSTVWSASGGTLFVKVHSHVNMPAVLSQLKTIYDRYNTQRPFEYLFMDEVFNDLYRAEDKLARILSGFTAFTLLIACLGLFGLATFTAEQRTKEIGIRKVLGASVQHIATLVSRDFIKLVGIAIILACPVAWWVMNRWLQNFAYRTSVSWWIFLSAGAIALTVTIITVSIQAIRAATANPVKSLRTE